MLQFILGSPGSGKSHFLYQRIIDESIRHPEQNFLILVPEQFSLAAQAELVREHPRGGVLNIDVLSLNRLAYRIFDETGTSRHELLEESGKSIVLRRISLENKKEMPYLSRQLTRPGSIAAVKSVLSELMQYNVTEEKLLATVPSATPELQQKLTDIASLLTEYKEYCRAHFMNAEEVPLYLAQKIPASSFLRNCTVALDGFTGFTPSQLPVIRELLLTAKNVYITAVTDRSCMRPDVDRPELFRMTSTMIRQVTRLAEEHHVPAKEPVFLENGPEGRLAASPALTHLEAHVFRSPGKRSADFRGILLQSRENPAEEVRAAARMIRKRIRQDGLRFRDIALISGDLPLYGDLVRRIFPEYDIPFFIDEKRTLLTHPYTEFLRAALQLFTEGWSADAMFRLLRTGLTDLPSEGIDELENYVLACGIRSKKRWCEPWRGDYQGFDNTRLPAVNTLRESAASLLAPMHEAFTGKDATAKEKTKVLYEMSAACHVQEKLKAEEDALRERGEMALSLEYAQIYGIVMRLFDKMADILGDYTLSAKDYRALFEAALSETRIGITPPTGDQVMVGDVERSRLTNIRSLLFLGANDGLIPHPPAENAILTEADKTALMDCGIELAPLPEDDFLRQRFYLYLALTKPSETLTVSYARTDMNGAAQKPSFLVREVSRLFSGLSVTHEQEEAPDDIETPADGLHKMPSLFVKPLSPNEKQAYFELYRTLLLYDPDDLRIRMIPEAAGLTAHPEQLDEKTALSLYGRTLRNSVTRLEQFAACAFRHFASFGLRLRERQVFSYSGIDRGNILHKALEDYAGEIRKSGRLWQEVPVEERDALADRCLENTAAVYNGRLLHDTASSEYEIVRLKRMMRRTVQILTEQLSRGDFVPSGFEVQFRETEELPLSGFDPSGTVSMVLNGKIDRIDICETDGAVLVKIIDYKSGVMKYDLFRIYEGLQLQLLTYLDAALTLVRKSTGRAVRPAGIFYYSIDDPVVKADPAAPAEEKEEAILSALMPSGIVSGEGDVLPHLDKGLGRDYAKSSVIPVSLNKNGSVSSSSPVVPEEDFAYLRSFARKKAAAIACSILKGEASVAPYRDGNKTACDLCPFISVCGLDRRIPGSGYRDLERIPDDELMSLIASYGKEENDVLDKGSADRH